MKFDTSMEYKGGKLAVRESSRADTRQPLPEVKATDNLASGSWGASWKQQAGKHGEDSALSSLGDVQAAMAATFARYSERRELQDPEHTQYRHLQTLARAFDSDQRALAERLDRAQANAQSRLQRLEDEFRQAVKWSTTDASELRAVIRGMDTKARSELLAQAAADGDGQVLAAVLSAHPSLSGLDAAQHKGLRQRAMQAHRPDLFKLEQVLQDASKRTKDAFVDLMEAGDSLTAKDLRAQYEAQAERARKAAAGE